MHNFYLEYRNYNGDYRNTGGGWHEVGYDPECSFKEVLSTLNYYIEKGELEEKCEYRVREDIYFEGTGELDTQEYHTID